MNPCIGIGDCRFEYDIKHHRVTLHGYDFNDIPRTIDLNSPSDLLHFCREQSGNSIAPHDGEISSREPYQLMETSLRCMEDVGAFFHQRVNRRGVSRITHLGEAYEWTLLRHELAVWCQGMIYVKNAEFS